MAGPEQLPEITVRPEGVPDPVDINPVVPKQDTGATIDMGENAPKLPSADTAAARSNVFGFGLGHVLGQTADELNEQIVSGHEKDIRSQAAATLNAKDAQAKTDLIHNILTGSSGPVDPKQIQQILNRQPMQTDPDTVAERAFGHEYINGLDVADTDHPGTEYGDAKKVIPQTVEDIKREHGDLLGRRQYAITLMQNVQDDIAKQSSVGYAADWLKGVVPFYNDVKLRGWLENQSAISGLGLGNNLDEETQTLLQMPFDEYKTNIDRIITKLRNDNPQMAAAFLQAVVGQSTTTKFLNNFSTFQSAISVPGVGAAYRLGLARSVEEAAQDSVRSVRFGERAPELADIPQGWWAEQEPNSNVWFLKTQSASAEGAGDLERSGVKKAAASVIADNTGNANPKVDALESLVSSMRIDQQRLEEAPGYGGQNIANRIRAKVDGLTTNIIDTIERIKRVDRIPDVLASEVAVRAIKDDIKQNFRGVPDSVADVSGPKKDIASNTYSFDLHITQPDGTLFKTKIQAQGYAKAIGLLDANVEPVATSTNVSKHGMFWKIITTVPLNEDSKVVRDLIAETPESRLQGSMFDGWVNATVGRFRTPKEVLSIEENLQREKATHSPSVLLGLVKESVKDVKRLPKVGKTWKEWNRAVDYSRRAFDPETGDPGYFFSTGQELDDHYLQNFNRLPSELEKEAYFAVKRNTELDRIGRVIQEYGNKARWGAQQHQVSYYEKNGNKVSSPFVEGRISKEMPGEGTVYVQHGKGKGRIYRTSDPGFYNNKIMRNKVNSGEMQVLQIWNTEANGLKGFGGITDQKISHVITDKIDTKALDWENQIARRGGGHFVYDYNYYIKQAKIRAEKVGQSVRHWYEGDTTVMPVSVRALGSDLIQHMNAVREFLKDGKYADAEAYHTKSPLPFDWDTHLGWYTEQKDNRGIRHPPRLNLNEPLHVVAKDKTVMDLGNELRDRYGATFRDGTMEGNPARQNQVEFTGPRDAHEVYTVNDYGSRKNPLYKYEPAKMVDPLPTMNRAMNNMVKSLFMNDMKAYSINHFLKEAIPHMDVRGGAKAVFNSPFYYFHNIDNFWAKDADKKSVNTLKAAHYMIKQFEGTPNVTETAIHSITQVLTDSIYRNLGQRFVPSWMLSRITDPAAYVRSAVVHAKLGLFNLPSFWVQASTFTNIMGIAGVQHAAPGAVGVLLHTWGRVNRDPAILAKLDEYASQFGHKPGHWLEANEELMNRGFFSVGHEQAMIDAPYTNQVIKSKWGTFLDAGQVFFREGAQAIRAAAWYTAHHEYRSKNPTGRITDRDWDRIQGRAADLDHNMSRAANSRLQSGIMSFPMQFNTYAMRLAELMTGKRLTGQEKARLFMTSSIMYGLPLGGLGLYAFPVGDELKKTAKAQGYTIGDGFWNDVIMQGLPEAAIGHITGQFPNISERWGVGQLDPIKEGLMSDEPLWKVVGGATGSTFANTFENAMPIMKVAMAFMQGKSAEYPPTVSDITDIFNEISTENDIKRILTAYNTGNWVSKNGTVLQSDIPKMSAIAMSAFGLSPGRVAGLNSTYQLEQDQKAMYKEAEGRAIKQLRFMYQAKADNNSTEADKYLIRAMSELNAVGYPDHMRYQVWTAAAKGWESLVNIADQEYYLHNVPKGQEETRLAAYRKLHP